MNVDTLALIIALLGVGGLAALGFGFVSIARRPGAVERRLAHPLMVDATVGTPIQLEAKRTSRLAKLLSPLARFARPARAEEMARLQQKLQQGGVRSEHAAAVFLGLKVILAGAVLALFLWYNAQRIERLEPAFAIAVVAFAAGFYLPDLWLSSRKTQRQTAIERGLPDALDLLVTCVEAGLGLDASLQRVSDEIRIAWPVLAGELQTTFLEVKTGIPRIEAFRRMASRTGVRDLKSLAATLTQTEIFGTSIAAALRIQAEGIRVRRMQRAEEKAAYISVKMTIPLVLCILPSLLLIIMGPAVIKIAANLLPRM